MPLGPNPARDLNSQKECFGMSQMIKYDSEVLMARCHKKSSKIQTLDTVIVGRWSGMNKCLCVWRHR